MSYVYFDNASSSLPVENDTAHYGNPSTTHALGVKAYNALNQARKELSEILSVNKDEIVFTSGGTESNNLAIIGYGHAMKRYNLKYFALPWAHPSVIHACNHLAELENIETFFIHDFETQILKSGINFVCIPQICHETGNKLDVEKLSSSLKTVNSKNIIFLDGAQGFCKEKINLKNIDLYSFSSHKVHGPTGVGGLVIKNVRLAPLIHGGGQENGIRAGTQNVHGCVLMAQAAKKLYENINKNHETVLSIKNEILKLTGDLPKVHVNSNENSSPYILNMSFLGVKGEVLVNMLSERGIYISTGAACKALKKDIPPLALMGYNKVVANSAVRFSFSPYNRLCEAVHVRKSVAECVNFLRKINFN